MDFNITVYHFVRLKTFIRNTFAKKGTVI